MTRTADSAGVFAAIARKDVSAAVRVLQTVGKPFEQVDETHLKADVRDFVGTYYGLPLEKLRVGQLLHDFLSILSTHHIRCPGDLMLLVRAVVALEGTGRQLDPHFNLAEHLAPFIEQVIRRRYEPVRLADRFLLQAGDLAEVAGRLPFRLEAALDKLGRDELKVELDVSNPKQMLAPGMFAEVQWPVSRGEPSLFVPTTAVVRTSERQFVVRIRNGAAEWVDVRRGESSGSVIEVFGDLREGDTVVRRGSDEIRPGTKVTEAATKS